MTITNQTGFFTGAIDGMGLRAGADFQWQYAAVLTTKAGICEHHRNNQLVSGEQRLSIVLTGGNVYPDMSPAPYPVVPVTIPFAGAELPDVEGGTTIYAARAEHYSYGANCAASQKSATAGQLDLTRVDADGIAGSYSFTFPAGTVTGTFDVPQCIITEPRPGGKPTCLPS